MTTLFKSCLTSHKKLIDEELPRLIAKRTPSPHDSSPLYRGMLHSLSAGGKRLRGAMLIEAGLLAGAGPERTLYAALAVEMLHTYSLIHDDLPAMDNATMRRGQAALHLLVGDGQAVLAGDALLTEAFGILAEPPLGVTAEQGLKVLALLAEGAGLKGMVRGQEWDLHFEHKRASAEELLRIHTLKTAALFRAALLMGATLGKADTDMLTRLDDYGMSMGLAFQIRDDLLDLDANSGSGKDSGLDAAHDKTTYPALFGVAESRARLASLLSQAEALMTPYGAKAQFFIELCHSLSLPGA